MTANIGQERPTDAPASYRTARRPGQSGAQGQCSAGPSPLSANPTGPHPPYEPHDPEGLAAGKHVKTAPPQPEPVPVEKDLRRRAGITVIGEDR
jgi:hypothetical protein